MAEQKQAADEKEGMYLRIPPEIVEGIRALAGRGNLKMQTVRDAVEDAMIKAFYSKYGGKPDVSKITQDYIFPPKG